MTEQEYNAAEGIRRSDLWRMNDSPEKFKYFLENPVEQTPAMAFGSMCHMRVLEWTLFQRTYVIAPNVDKRTKAGKEIWEKFISENECKIPISQDDADTLEAMYIAISNCGIASKLINAAGQSEVPIFWTDPDTGEKCKAKLDRLVKDDDGNYVVVDYKTAAHADTERFNREIFNLGYHFQAGFYTEGVKQNLKLDYLPRFVFVAQEKKAPFSVNVIEVSEDVMKVGVAKFHELLEKYHECKAVDIWPGYVDDVANETQLPGWWSLTEEEE